MSTQKFITDPESVRLSRIGELKIDGKPALNLASDMRSASRPVFFHLAHNYPDLLAVAAGMGLSVKGRTVNTAASQEQSLKLCYSRRSSFAKSRLGLVQTHHAWKLSISRDTDSGSGQFFKADGWTARCRLYSVSRQSESGNWSGG